MAAMSRVSAYILFPRMCAGGVATMIAMFALGISVSRAANDEYFPLASGNEWIMELHIISSNGDKSNGVLHRRIGEAVQHNGKTYFRSHTWLENSRPFAMDYTKLVRRDDAGFYSI